MFEIKNLTIKKDGLTLVKDVSFTIRPKEIVILSGKNGAGKSSLLKGILGYPGYQIVNGNIFLNGEDITNKPIEERASLGLYLALQSPPTIEGLSLYNLISHQEKKKHGEGFDPKRLRENMLALEKKYGLPEGAIDRGINLGLSGGEKRRLELLQLTTFFPKIAFLDEIDSGVDLETVPMIYKTLKELSKDGMSILLVTHHPLAQTKLKPNHTFSMADGELQISRTVLDIKDRP